jgi:uncharacterized zinc-type alcohol dehydrogenase-like protein
MAVKLAGAFGARVVVFTTSAGKAEDAVRLGAHDIVVSRNAAEMQKHVGSFDFVLDTVSAEQGITADVEVIPIQKINEAYDRLAKGDVKYRFVIDMASLK